MKYRAAVLERVRVKAKDGAMINIEQHGERRSE